ncbi:MAG: transcription-repair coupling factor, partial [Christensenellaceae bacterium]|nr:transcription-repair coupling factor [Christensenellaceae bacterium]
SYDDERLRALSSRMLYELEDTGTFPNIEAYADVFSEKSGIMDWAGDALIITNDLFKIISEHTSRLETSQVLFAEVLNNGGAFGCEMSSLFELEAYLAENSGKITDIGGLLEDKTLKIKTEIEADVLSAVGFMGNMEMLADAIRERLNGGFAVYLFASSRARQLSGILQEMNLTAPVTDGKTTPGLSIVNARLQAGFAINDAKALFLSEQDIFGRKLKNAKKNAKKKPVLDLVADLKAGDTVVHEIYGKGRYKGIKNMEVGGAKGDYLEIEYKDGDKLFIKTSQIDKISRFVGSDDDAKRLSKLGGKEWDNAKQKARSSVKKLTEDLVSIYEERAKIKGFRYAEDTPWQSQFEDNFEYEETEGQLQCIEQIKRDMQSTKVMDRLLLGDVGYGKTEVAMRAAFKAVMDSKQVAVLVPTTLLARQHYKTFLDRFSGFPIKIAMLSRFTKNPGKVVAEVNSGAVDIIIGTHKLFSKTVKYKNLGLLIIDEEQRFGVSHKERIKDMKRTVDVLTLTATPIPRTLEMAMTGIRDISTIDTPPEDRKEVVAYVAEFSWQIVREAIMRELARGGQAYFVCRRISQMDELLRSLHLHVPEARVAMAHGQMSEETFESVISAFYEKQFDVLLSTTIIESGIDIPNVNTIIIYEADMFGLAQLYQLKGRVGRSHLRAYAYFTHLRTDSMNEVAQKRLSAIREFTQFGSGYKIAMRDLEIRGAGNILGAEQSGHMAQIGYNLYCKFIRQEVDELMGRPEPLSLDTEVDLGMDAYIPEKYIPDEAQKLDMYRAAGNIRTTQDVTDLRDVLQERYGTPPKQVENLLAYRLIRSYAEKAGIASVIRQPKFVELKFAEEDLVYVDEAMARRVVSQYPLFANYRASTPPAIILKPQKNFINEMLRLMSQLRRCIKAAHKV